MIPTVTPEHWERLEVALRARWQSHHVAAVWKALHAWSGWRYPSDHEILEAIGGIAQQARARRLQAARAELPIMRGLPPITPAADVPLLELRRRFGTRPVTIVYPHDRFLSPFHAAAIVGRGWSMTRTVARIVGGCFLRSMVDLVREENLERELERGAASAGWRWRA